MPTWPIRSLLPVLVGLMLALHSLSAQVGNPGWTDRFGERREDLATIGRNPFFNLEPGYRLILEHGTERLVITVLQDTMLVDSVWTRVVEERETNGEALVEVSRNYYAISRRTNSVYYFGEDVDIYRDGAVASHEGAWRAGVNGARYGMMMPGVPAIGKRFQQETAPGVAMDRARIVALDATLTTPAGEFTGLLRIEETTPLEPGAKEYKLYAAGVGLVRDGDLKLVSYGRR
ncbi:MAG: hypothetical protein AB7I33_00680 [Gemmatimonadales bacterium]